MRAVATPFICKDCRCLALRQAKVRCSNRRSLATTAARPLPPRAASADDEARLRNKREHEIDQAEEEAEQGALSRRLAAMSEEMLEAAPSSAAKTVEAAGFDEELKQRLLERIASADYNSQNAAAMSTLNMPAAAGRGTRGQAAARAWDGNETLEDATLRMLDDAHKRIRRPARVSSPVRTPTRVDAGRPGSGQASTGSRLVNARDKTSTYAYLKDESLSSEERNKMRQQLKERFTSAGRSSAPATLSGLASLADQRIDDAIARGQFKNLPRGKPIERDYNMSSPFLDTTEYFMNKIMERQQIVPPWIEKQQELVSEAARFRGRLRNDWLRHAARTIASRGGSLEAQVARADEFARAEQAVNPRKPRRESVTSVDDKGSLSQINLQGELKIPPADSKQTPEEPQPAASIISMTSQPLDGSDKPTTETRVEPVLAAPQTPPAIPAASKMSQETAPSPQTAPEQPLSALGWTPFRDDAYLAAEMSYLRAALDSLNALARSYNLMAPNMAKRPYFVLERELLAVYADVAPLVAGEIRARHLRAQQQGMSSDGQRLKRGPRLLDGLGGPAARVHDDRREAYGLKEFWRDMFAGMGGGPTSRG